MRRTLLSTGKLAALVDVEGNTRNLEPVIVHSAANLKCSLEFCKRHSKVHSSEEIEHAMKLIHCRRSVEAV
jgi:hypothetical protein